MSATQDTMIAAAEAMEKAVEQLAAAYGFYTSALVDARRRADRGDDLEATLGSDRILETIACRLRALGVDVDRATTGGRVGPEWVSGRTRDIQRLVP